MSNNVRAILELDFKPVLESGVASGRGLMAHPNMLPTYMEGLSGPNRPLYVLHTSVGPAQDWSILDLSHWDTTCSPAFNMVYGTSEYGSTFYVALWHVMALYECNTDAVRALSSKFIGRPAINLLEKYLRENRYHRSLDNK